MPVIYCPEKFIIGPRLAKELFPEAWATASGPVKQSLTKLSLLREKANGGKSIYKPYIDALPKELDSPIFWSDHEQEWLRGTNVFGEINVKVEQWRQEWEVLKTTVFPGKAEFEGEGVYAFEEYKWACGIFMSRAFPARVVYPAPGAGPGPGPGQDQDHDLTMLVPGVDALNHKPRAAVLWDGTSSTSGFTVSVCAPVAAGDQVFNNYGPKSNEELLLGYGFCVQDATAFDAVLLKLGVPRWIPNRAELMRKAGDGLAGDADAVVFRLVHEWNPFEGGMAEMFCVLARGPQYAGLPATLAETVRGFDALEAAVRQKHHALAAGGDLFVGEQQQQQQQQPGSPRLESVLLYRRTQARLLCRCIQETRSARAQVLTRATEGGAGGSVLSLGQVLGDEERSADPYFGDLGAALAGVYGVDTVAEVVDSDCADAVLSFVVCHERLQGSLSRFSNFLNHAWAQAAGPVDAEDAPALLSALFPPDFKLAEAVARFPSVFHNVEAWTPEFMAAGLGVVDRNLYEDPESPESVRLLFENPATSFLEGIKQ